MDLSEAPAIVIRRHPWEVARLDFFRGRLAAHGLDPLLVACEGRFVAFVPRGEGDEALAVLRTRPDCAGAARIGVVVPAHPGVVVLESPISGERVLDLPSGEQLPRIC